MCLRDSRGQYGQSRVWEGEQWGWRQRADETVVWAIKDTASMNFGIDPDYDDKAKKPHSFWENWGRAMLFLLMKKGQGSFKNMCPCRPWEVRGIWWIWLLGEVLCHLQKRSTKPNQTPKDSSLHQDIAVRIRLLLSEKQGWGEKSKGRKKERTWFLMTLLGHRINPFSCSLSFGFVIMWDYGFLLSPWSCFWIEKTFRGGWMINSATEFRARSLWLDFLDKACLQWGGEGW